MLRLDWRAGFGSFLLVGGGVVLEEDEGSRRLGDCEVEFAVVGI